MDRSFQVDIDQGKVLYQGEWCSARDLAEKIRQMLEKQDFRIASAGLALEYLQKTLQSLRVFQVKLTGEEALLLEQHAARAAISPEAFLRQAAQAYLAALSPPEQPAIPTSAASVTAAPAISAITTEPATPQDASRAVELKTKKSEPAAKVLVDPSLLGADQQIEGEWFKK